MIIDLELKNYRGFSDAQPARFRISAGFTAFVGANNSGKSSLLQFLYDFRPLFQWLQEPGTMEMLARGEPVSYGFPGRSDGFHHNGNDRPLSAGIVASADSDPANMVRLSLCYERNGRLSVEHVPPGAEQGYGPAVTYPDVHLDKLLAALTDTMYVGAFRNALNLAPQQGTSGIHGDPVYFDLRTGRQFVDWWRDWKSGDDRVNNERAYRVTRDLDRIFELGGLEINAVPSWGEFQLFIEGKSYRLAELGSGLTQFLVVLANAAHRRPSWILIDEPELNLHPALQLDFLTTLASYAGVGVVFATHSVGLARSVAERIYACSRGPARQLQVRHFEAVQSLAEFLGELSFSTHRELGFDTVLLVEGATEVPVLQQLLRRMRKENRVVLLPLGGSSLINARSEPQLAEVVRIAPKVAALIDSERTADGEIISPDRQAFVGICARLQIDCHVLERRAIENYLPARAIQAIKGQQYRALEPYELLKKLPLGWAKPDNWRIMAEARTDELIGTDLYEFLERI